MLTVVHDTEDANDKASGAGRSLLDEIVRDGARQMLAAALQAEVAAYVAQFADQLDENGHRLVVRNGYHQPREVLTAAGAVQVKAPRVNDRRVDPDTGTVHLVSIPRDTMITLNGNTEKINAAFAYGGAASAVNAVSKLAGVPITHFVEVGFEGVIDVVDYVGGVWVNVPEPFSGGGYYFDAGEQLVCGAVQFFHLLVLVRKGLCELEGDLEGLMIKELSAVPVLECAVAHA